MITTPVTNCYHEGYALWSESLLSALFYETLCSSDEGSPIISLISTHLTCVWLHFTLILHVLHYMCPL